MTFRANESARDLLDAAVHRLTRGLEPENRDAAAAYICAVADDFGPAVTRYPQWHPFICFNSFSETYAYGRPCHHTGWDGIDHEATFQRAFITCPYGGIDAIQASAKTINGKLRAMGLPYQIKVEPITEVKLHHETTTPALVSARGMGGDSSAVEDAAAITNALHTLRQIMEMGGDVIEPWENVKEFFLGTPCGTRSSLFVSERAGSTMRRLLSALNKSGVFGDEMAPINRTRR